MSRDARAYPNKPDAREPWRYACPECGSVSIQGIYSVDGEPRYECQRCHAVTVAADLVDRASAGAEA